jgi:hypothetical protein
MSIKGHPFSYDDLQGILAAADIFETFASFLLETNDKLRSGELDGEKLVDLLKELAREYKSFSQITDDLYNIAELNSVKLPPVTLKNNLLKFRPRRTNNFPDIPS